MLKKKLITFVSVFGIAALWSVSAFAQTGAAADNYFTMFSWLGLAAGLAMGVAAFGGAMGQGKAANAALEGIARNPGAAGKMFMPFILSLVFIETLVIFTFALAFLIQGNIDMSLIGG